MCQCYSSYQEGHTIQIRRDRVSVYQPVGLDLWNPVHSIAPGERVRPMGRGALGVGTPAPPFIVVACTRDPTTCGLVLRASLQPGAKGGATRVTATP